MPQALFYPWIDIRDESWLKTAVLYWDSVRTIVPEPIDMPYSTDTGRALEEAGFLVPLRIHSGMEEVEDLAPSVMRFFDSPEGVELLISQPGSGRNDVHLEKLPSRFRDLVEIHPEKLPYEIRRRLEGLTQPSERGSEWLSVDDSFANFYMTLLATRLAERIGAGVLTSLPAADRLAGAARLDAQLNGVIPWGVGRPWRRWREYEAFGARRRFPRHLAPGLLAQLAIERIAVAPDTPVDRLIEFRERHSDELGSFRSKIAKIASSIEEDLPLEALRQRLEDLYDDEVRPAVSNLKEALNGQRIRSTGNGFLKVAFLSAGSSSLMVASGLAVPTALLAGAGLSLVVSSTLYNSDKRDTLRQSPFSYLLSAERELA